MATLRQKRTEDVSGKNTWQVYLDGSDNELNQIDNVKYILPPAKFPRREVAGMGKDDNFRMEVSGFNPIDLELNVTYTDPTIPPKKIPYTLRTDGTDPSVII